MRLAPVLAAGTSFFLAAAFSAAGVIDYGQPQWGWFALGALSMASAAVAFIWEKHWRGEWK